MAFLRTVSTRRLLALIAASVAVVAGGTAIAVAATSAGPVPKAEPLAQAVHGALTDTPAVTGISARISFTNQLISSSDLGEGSDPLLTGATTGRLWLSSNHQLLRLELQGSNGDAQVVLNGRSFWVYDPSSNTVYRGQLPAETAKAAATKQRRVSGWTAYAPLSESAARQAAVPSIAKIQTALTKLGKHLDLSGATPGDVAGQPAYSVQVSQPHGGGLLGAVKVAWDAARGVPLQFAVYATGNSSPVLKLSVTDISFGSVPASDFAVAPPVGAKVVNLTASSGATAKGKRANGKGRATAVTGVAAVAKQVPFSLATPARLAGLRRSSVRLLGWAGSPAALVSYGHGLAGIAVIEQRAPSPASTASTRGNAHQELQLPTVSIDGVTGQELPTALGTMIQFTRAGVAYTVLGSVPPATAVAAARGL